MPRIRTLKPEILEDEKTASLDDHAWRLFVSLIVLADDYGNVRAHPEWLAAQVFWGSSRDSRISSRESRESLARLSRGGLISLYQFNSDKYAHIVNWDRHQRVDKPGKPRIPSPDDPKSSTWSISSRENPGVSRGSRESLATDLGPRTIGSRTLDHIGPIKPKNSLELIVDRLSARWLAHFEPGKRRVSQRQQAHLAARLKSGRTEEELARCIDFIANDPWHQEQGQVRLELACRSDGQVEQCLAKLEAKPARSKQEQTMRRSAEAFLRGRGFDD